MQRLQSCTVMRHASLLLEIARHSPGQVRWNLQLLFQLVWTS